MKKLFILAAGLGGFLTTAHAQVSLGIRAGISPATSPATNHIIINRNDYSNECLFKLHDIGPSGQFGLMLRTDNDHFWFMGEILYGQSITRFSAVHTSELSTGQNDVYRMRTGFLMLPASVGVRLGKIEIFSGLYVKKTTHVRSELERMNGYSAALPSLTYGVQSGIGVSLDRVLLDLRYQLDFCQYGEGLFINGQELILKNAPGRIFATAAFRISGSK